METSPSLTEIRELKEEIRELKEEVSGLRSDLIRFIERANQEHLDSVLGDLKKEYSEVFANHLTDSAGSNLSAHMVSDCAMRDDCFELFMDFLQNTSRHIRDGRVSEEVIQSYRDRIQALREEGPSDQCDTCFSEVYRLFEKQVDLMQSLGIYERAEEEGDCCADVVDDDVVGELLEPIANIQRFQILQALTYQSRTFSDLSDLTGLRAGNLLFHIRKLTKSGMVLQVHDRGSYIITDKGYRTFTAIRDLFQKVRS